MTTAELAALITGLPPAHVPAVLFYLEAQAGDIGWLQENQPVITQALAELAQQLRIVKQQAEQCTQLQPIPTNRPPAGI